MNVISIMIVDNDPDRAAALFSSLGTHEDLKVLSSVSKREIALKQLSLGPDVVLLYADVLKQHSLPRFLRTMKSRSPKTRLVLLLSTRPDDDVLIENIRQGVRGHILASAPPALIAKAVRAVEAGEIWAERRLLERTITRHMLLPEKLQSHVQELQPLTSREMDMLNQVLKGSTNREIAEMSNISERTVKTHLYRVYRKLKVKSRTKAIALLTQ